MHSEMARSIFGGRPDDSVEMDAHPQAHRASLQLAPGARRQLSLKAGADLSDHISQAGSTAVPLLHPPNLGEALLAAEAAGGGGRNRPLRVQPSNRFVGRGGDRSRMSYASSRASGYGPPPKAQPSSVNLLDSWRSESLQSPPQSKPVDADAYVSLPDLPPPKGSIQATFGDSPPRTNAKCFTSKRR